MPIERIHVQDGDQFTRVALPGDIGLRGLTVNDTPEVARVLTDPYINKYLHLTFNPANPDEVRGWVNEVRNRGLYFAIKRDARDGACQVVGHVGLKPSVSNQAQAEIGIVLDHDEQGRGTAMQAVLAALHIADRCGITKVQARIHPGNHQSRKLFRHFSDSEHIGTDGCIVVSLDRLGRLKNGFDGLFYEGRKWFSHQFETIPYQSIDSFIRHCLENPVEAIPQDVLLQYWAKTDPSNEVRQLADQAKAGEHLPISHFWWQRAVVETVLDLDPLTIEYLKPETMKLAAEKFFANPLTTKEEIINLANNTTGEVMWEPLSDLKSNAIFNACCASLSEAMSGRDLSQGFNSAQMGFEMENYRTFFIKVLADIRKRATIYETRLPYQNIVSICDALGLSETVAGLSSEQLRFVLPLFCRYLELYIASATLLPKGYNFNETDMRLNLKLLLERHLNYLRRQAENHIEAYDINELRQLADLKKFPKITGIIDDEFNPEETFWEELAKNNTVSILSRETYHDTLCFQLERGNKQKIIYVPVGNQLYLSAALVAAEDFLMHPEEYPIGLHFHEFLETVPAGTGQQIKAQSVSDILYVTTLTALRYANTVAGWRVHFRHEADHLWFTRKYAKLYHMIGSPTHLEGWLYYLRHRFDMNLFWPENGRLPVFGPMQLLIDDWENFSAGRWGETCAIWFYICDGLRFITPDPVRDLVDFLYQHQDLNEALSLMDNLDDNTLYSNQEYFFHTFARFVFERLDRSGLSNPEMAVLTTGNFPLVMMEALMQAPETAWTQLPGVRQLYGKKYADEVTPVLERLRKHPEEWYALLYFTLENDFKWWKQHTNNKLTRSLDDAARIGDPDLLEPALKRLIDIQTGKLDEAGFNYLSYREKHHPFLVEDLGRRLDQQLRTDLFNNSFEGNDVRLTYLFMRYKLLWEYTKRTHEWSSKQIESRLDFLESTLEDILAHNITKGVFRESLERTTEYIRSWIAKTKEELSSYEFQPVAPAGNLEARKSFHIKAEPVTSEKRAQVVDVLRQAEGIGNFTCDKQLIPFATNNGGELFLVEAAGQQRLVLRRETPIPQARIMFSQTQKDEELVSWLQRTWGAEYIAYNLLPEPIDGLGEPVLRMDLVCHLPGIATMINPEVGQKYRRAQRANPGLRYYPLSGTDAEKETITRFFETWDAQGASEPTPMSTGMDRRFLDMYWGDPHVWGGLAMIGKQAVGVELGAPHSVRPDHATGIVLKTDHQYTDIGTFLQVERAKRLVEKGFRYLCYGDIGTTPEQYLYKEPFLRPGGMVNVSYSYKLKGPELGNEFLKDFYR
ncbi:GNAT family N-acetyltransferase [Candidatus Microgenomates bacterium]|nr:GNAT family N-acetyltransferase [Candidatus Microgenomates bacterium]